MEPVSTLQGEEVNLSYVEPRLFDSHDSSSYEASSSIDTDQEDVSMSNKDIRQQHRQQGSPNATGTSQPSAIQHDKLQLASGKGHYEDFHVNIDPKTYLLDSANASDIMAGSSGAFSGEHKTGPGLTPRRPRSKKRKAEKSAARNSKVKRLRGIYNDNYRILLNENIQDAVSLADSEDFSSLPQSQLGIIVWTSAEKEKFFTALARLGKDNIRGIASRIGSKSEIETHEYIHLLQQGVLEKIQNEPRRQLLGLTSMPAASQLSDECCYALEKAADALAFRQEKYEEHIEQKKWGENWLLTSKINSWVEECMEEEGSSPNIREILPAAELLNLRNWLELSSRVFMNSAVPKEGENWHDLAAVDEEPAIRATAFSDFYHLTISIMKKLISATIFCTMSRLRAMDSRSFRRHEMIKVADVEAAAKILGLDINSEKFWLGCPRRCNLKVYKRLSLSAAGQIAMSYDEVEDVLSRKEKLTSVSSVRTNGLIESPVLLDGDAEVDNEEAFLLDEPDEPDELSGSDLESVLSREETLSEFSKRDLASEYMKQITSEFHGPIDPSDSEFDHPNKHHERLLQRAKLRMKLDQIHEEYAEASDLQASLVEEQKLWNILKQDPPFTIKFENMELPEQPRQHRKEVHELDDWRNHLKFASEWEMLEKPIPAGAFSRRSEHRGKNRVSTSSEGEGDEKSKTADGDFTELLPQDVDLSSEEGIAANSSDVPSDDSSNSS